MPTIPFSTIQNQLEKIDQLESQVSPENFWCDGEKSDTPANRRQWQRLQMRLEKAQVRGEGLFAKLTPEQRKAVLDKLPERLRFTGRSLLPPVQRP